jgi:hypothetical protein
MWSFVPFEKPKGEIDIDRNSLNIGDLLLLIEKEFPCVSPNEIEILPTKLGFTLRRKKTIGRML